MPVCVCVCVFPEQAAGSSGLPAADPHSGLSEPQPKPGPDELALGETDSRSAVIIKTFLNPPAAPMLLTFCIMLAFFFSFLWQGTVCYGF